VALTPEGIARDIEANGAKAVVDRLWQENKAACLAALAKVPQQTGASLKRTRP
jgi:hypothetical protein